MAATPFEVVSFYDRDLLAHPPTSAIPFRLLGGVASLDAPATGCDAFGIPRVCHWQNGAVHYAVRPYEIV
jgi:hypothetical protein